MTSPPSSPAVAPDRRSYAALRFPAARTYLLLAALAMAADHVEHAISYWIIFEKFHSSFLAGFAVISHWVPFLLGSVWAGALALIAECRAEVRDPHERVSSDPR